MKKKLLTTVLTVGVVLSLVGCGAKETTSSESVAETTEVTTEYGTEETTVEEVVEETTVAETEAEVVEETTVEVVEESEGSIFMKELLANFESQQYVIIEVNDTKYADGINAETESTHEVLYNWANNVAATFSEESGVTYYDFTNNMAYVSNEDMTGFYKSESPDVKDYYTTLYDSVLKYWIDTDSNFVVEQAGAELYQATNNYSSAGGDSHYEVTVFVNMGTNLPEMVASVEFVDNGELVLEDGTTVTGDNLKKDMKFYKFQFLTEDAEDFATFQSATTLPADDECTLVEGETTTTE